MNTAIGAQASPRRALIVNRVGHIGGVERTILTLTEGMSAYGWQPTLACPDDGDLAAAAREQGTEVMACRFDRMRATANPKVLARYPAAMFHGSRALAQYCRACGVQVLHVHHPVTALYASYASRRLGIPIVLHVHETLPAHLLYALAMRAALRRVSSILCVSDAALRLAHALGADPARSSVVYNGIDKRLLNNATRLVPQEVELAGPGPHVGVFGVLEPRKAQHILLDAAGILAGRFPSARFWLVGEAALKDKQAYLHGLHRLAETPALRGRVCFTGFRSDVASWIGAMDIVVQPSTALESFGMAIAEAMAFGRAVVVTNVGGLPEVVRHGETGLVVPVNDAPALAAALEQLMQTSRLRARLGAEACRAARSRFAPEAFCKAVCAAYDSALPPRT